ncbi:hypothetical protein RCL1_007003 [Eukaryota sp. TZLM3-RCL]
MKASEVRLTESSESRVSMSEKTATDPTSRYLTHFEELGSGSYKTVYKAIDQEQGIEVAWNCIRISHLGEKERERLMLEVDVLKSITHPNIIECYAHWNDENHLVFITELMTSGTLRKYLTKVGSVRTTAIKNWCRQILDGLCYLHGRGIIHRDIKADNLFINGNHGEVKIGDLGLCAVLHTSTAQSVIGTPEFMAPELFSESYNELVDIWSFGLTVLEILTLQYPYAECANPAQVFRKVTGGHPPAILASIQDAEIRSLIELCLLPADYRPSSRTLRDLAFFEPEGVQGIIRKCKSKTANFCLSPSAAFVTSVVLNGVVNVKLFLRLTDGPKEVEFPFDTRGDTAEAVASEMVSEFGLTPEQHKRIVYDIQEAVDAIVEHYSTDSSESSRSSTPRPPTPTPVHTERHSKSLLSSPSGNLPHSSSELDLERYSSSSSSLDLLDLDGTAPLPSRSHSSILDTVDDPKLSKFAHEYVALQHKLLKSKSHSNLALIVDEVVKSPEILNGQGLLESDIEALMRQHEEELRNIQKKHILAYAQLRESQEKQRQMRIKHPNAHSASPFSSTLAPAPVMGSKSAPPSQDHPDPPSKTPDIHVVLPGDYSNQQRRRHRTIVSSAPEVDQELRNLTEKALELITKPKK